MDNDRIETFEKAIMRIADHYGIRHQSVKAMEEFGELIQAVAKGDKEMITEEIADAIVMIIQLCYLYGIDDEEVSEVIDNKLRRQLLRMLREVV